MVTVDVQLVWVMLLAVVGGRHLGVLLSGHLGWPIDKTKNGRLFVVFCQCFEWAAAVKSGAAIQSSKVWSTAAMRRRLELVVSTWGTNGFKNKHGEIRHVC